MEKINTKKIDTEKIEVEILEKHRNYLEHYKPNDYYWGLGIENETYLEMSKKLEIDKTNFYSKLAKRERYSVNYYNSYKPGIYDYCIQNIKLSDKVPILINAHSFVKTDINNNHMTTYTTNPQPNPKFNGKTIYEFLCEEDSYFKDEYMKSFIFDGDTIEFISQNFYKSTVKEVISNLLDAKYRFINKLRIIFEKHKIFADYGSVNICETNYPFITFMTNFKNCSIFNNMTYHLNFTLPTLLTDKCYIKDYKLFIEQHKNAIHLIQWIEPVLVALYGTGDVFSSINKNLTNTSQRIAKSRYIGLGTYDTDKMEPGKILQISSENNHLSNLDYWWFNKYYEISDYTKETQIGVDINFHKHKNHGIELRIFDYFETSKLEEIMIFIILLLDYSLENKIKSPVKNKTWNEFVVNILLDKNTKISGNIKNEFEKIFNINLNDQSILDLYNFIYKKLLKKYEYSGICYQNMVERKINTSCCILF
jgi:hypothetical protein